MERGKGRSSVDWVQRIITALIAIPIVCILILSSRAATWTGTNIAIIVAYYEFSSLIGYSLSLNYILLPMLTFPDFADPVRFLLVVANLISPIWSQGPRDGFRRGLLSTFFVCFFAKPLTYALDLRASGSHGPQLVLMWILVSFASDAGALVIGSNFGRTPCCPAISPKKTWEGVAGSVAIGTVTSILLGALHIPGTPNVDFHDAAALGFLTSSLGMIGDLIESGFKRHVDVKDASNLLPGHGGLLDRLDALAASVPAWYFYCQFRSL